jgi:non-ribosomal peptide synthetase component F
MKRLVLPTDYPRQPGAMRVRRVRPFHLSADLQARLEARCGPAEVTPFMWLLATWQVLLQRYCRSDDIAVCVPVANRDQREIQGVIGLIYNVIVLRTDSSGDPTFHELLARVRQTALEGFEHQQLPLTCLSSALPPLDDSLGGSPTPAEFNYHQKNTRERFRRFPDRQPLGLDPGEQFERGAFDVLLTIFETSRGFRCRLSCDRSLYEPETVERMEQHYVELLEATIADPSRRLAQLAPAVTWRPRRPAESLPPGNERVDPALPPAAR